MTAFICKYGPICVVFRLDYQSLCWRGEGLMIDLVKKKIQKEVHEALVHSFASCYMSCLKTNIFSSGSNICHSNALAFVTRCLIG